MLPLLLTPTFAMVFPSMVTDAATRYCGALTESGSQSERTRSQAFLETELHSVEDGIVEQLGRVARNGHLRAGEGDQGRGLLAWAA
jgi:hypothetical protein